MSKNIKRRDLRAYQALYSGGVRCEVKEAPVCPYCGQKMVLKDGEELNNSWANQMRYICPNNDSSARAEIINGKFVLVSTPANKELRKLRNEAHFWMSKLEETGTINGKQAVATYLSNKITVGASHYVHIGSLREAGCMEVIKASVEKLYENRANFDRFPGYKYSCTFKDKELWEMVKAISLDPRKTNA